MIRRREGFGSVIELDLLAELERMIAADPGAGGTSRSRRGAMDSIERVTTELERNRLVRLEAVARMDHDGDHLYDGYTSPTAFLIHRCGMTPGEAQREVSLARSLAQLPAALARARSGRLTVSQLEMLAQCRRRHPEQFAVDEAMLAEAVTGLVAADTRRALDYWCQAHCRPPDPASEEPTRVFLSRTLSGRGRLDGDLAAEDFELLESALDTLISELVRTTPRHESSTPSQRRGEALSELARRQLASDATPSRRGSRPAVTVVVDWEVLTGHSRAGLSEFLDGTVVAPATARRLACDAEVCRLLTGPEGEILDLGRSVRTATPAQWKALRIRDRHCRFPGCRRPWSWCDAHHLDWWWDQEGATDVGRMVLLCRHHHTLVHREGWLLVGEPQALTVIRPDGTELPTRSPP